MDNVCVYLRKSRADVEKEKIEEFETLSRHRSALMKFANDNGLNIVRVYEELESGESIIHRPEMIRLLREVEEKKYSAVLCMDIDRLGRGNMQEQGLILDTFKNSGTKIVTPRKTYDLLNDFDQEYSEFEAFMARKELKLINRRLQSGRLKSIEEGNYISANPPYGYGLVRNGKKRTLIINEYEASVVRLIFALYADKNIGCAKIASELNELGYKSRTNIAWNSSSVLSVIKNPAYTGKLTWKKKTFSKSKTPDKMRESKSNPKSEWIIIDNCHDAIVAESVFETAQKKLKSRYHVPYINKVSNPLAGLVKCEICNASMVLRPYTKSAAHIICHKHCGNKSSKFVLLEKKIIGSIESVIKSHENLIKDYELDTDYKNYYENELKNRLKKLSRELREAKIQKDNLYDLVEKGAYNIDEFHDRLRILDERIKRVGLLIKSAEGELLEQSNIGKASSELISKLETVVDVYYRLSTAEQKNLILKSIIDYASYYKEKNWKDEHFVINVYFKI